MSEENRFYVYALLDPRKPGEYRYGEYSFKYEPFYVGKGHGNRCKIHVYEASKNQSKCNHHKCNKIQKIKRETGKNPIIKKLYVNLVEHLSFEYEKSLIKTIGRYDLGNGPLVNMTDGGEGSSGVIVSEETKRKMSERNIRLGIKPPVLLGDANPSKRPEVVEKIRKTNIKVWKSKELREKQRRDQTKIQNRPDIQKRRKETLKRVMPKIYEEKGEEISLKISKGLKEYYSSHPDKLKLISERSKSFWDRPGYREKRKAGKIYKFIDPNGNLVTILNLSKFCKENNLSYGSMNHVYFGKNKQHKGWTSHQEIISKKEISEETRKKMLLNNYKRKPIMIDGIEYISIKNAAKLLGLGSSTISRRLKAHKPGYKYLDKN